MLVAVARGGHWTARQSARLASTGYSPYLLAGALVALTFALYTPSLGYPYVYEDRLNPPVQWRGLVTELTDFQVLHPARFVSNLSYRATHAISLSPWADHLGNVIVHTVNTALLIAAAWPVFGAIALWMGAIYGLHPLQSEAVSYISARPDLLVATGMLLALCGVTYRRGAWLLIGLVVAALSKETGVMAAPVALLWAWRTDAAVKVWVIVALGVGAAVFLIGHIAEFPFLASPLLIGVHLAMVWRLLAFVALPFGLTIDHDWIWITPTIAGLAWIAWCFALDQALREHPESWIGFALVVTVLAVLPRVLLRDPEPFHEHHMVAPMIGIAIGLPLAARAGYAHLQRLYRAVDC